MTIVDKIRDEKLQYDDNRGAAKISALSSGTIDKYEYVTGEEIVPFKVLKQNGCYIYEFQKQWDIWSW